MSVEIDYDLEADPPLPSIDTAGGTGNSSGLSHVTTHAATAVDRLLWQWRNSTDMHAYVNAYASVFQDIEDALFEIIFLRNIKYGFGIQLDTIGKIVGRGRNGLGDDDYKIALYAQIRINRSSGTVTDFEDVLAISLPDGLTYYFVEGTASVAIVINEPITPGQRDAIWLNLRLTKALGVRLEFVFTLVDSAIPPFVYGANGDNDPSNVVDGFATTALSSGGQWDNVFVI